MNDTDTSRKLEVYFVQSMKTDKVDKNMVRAMKTCKESKLGPKWINKDVVLAETIATERNVVFVLKTFEGEVFDYLSNKESLVCGPKCIDLCVSSRIPIPENKSPVFNIPMLGLYIATTKLTKEKREEVKKKVRFMGGTFCNDLSTSVTHLICNEVKSTKCEKAAEFNINVMTTSWVDAVWSTSQVRDVKATDEEFEKFRIPAFQGLKITCSNLSQRVKTELQQIITRNGGIYSPSLVQGETDVVVLGEAKGDKFKHAQLWGIPCVSPSWVHTSVSKRVAVSVIEYLVKDRPTCSTPTNELPSFMSNTTEISMVRGGDSSKLEIDDTVSSVSSVASIKRGTFAKPSEPSLGSYRIHFDKLSLTEATQAGLFLDGCKVYLSGFNSQETDLLKKILNVGGATIFMQITDRVSHVVSGEFSPSDAKIISDLQPRPHVVSVEWILMSIRQKSPAEIQPYALLQSGSSLPPPSPLSHKGLELLKSKNVTPVDSPSSSAPVSRKLFVKNKPKPKKATETNPSVQPSELETTTKEQPIKDKEPEAKVVPEPERPPQREQSMTSGHNDTTIICDSLFKELTFELKEINNIEQAAQTIQSCGGTVVKPNFHGVADYAVVPSEGSDTPISAMETVTMFWIYDCIANQKLVNIEYFHQPLTLKPGCKPLEGTTICVSGYVGKERLFIIHVAELLGSIVQESFSRNDHPSKNILKSTHLLCSEPSGSKFSAAIKWGIPVIGGKWLLDCAKSGKLEPLQPYALAPIQAPTTPTGNTVPTTPALVPVAQKRAVAKPPVMDTSTSNRDAQASMPKSLGASVNPSSFDSPGGTTTTTTTIPTGGTSTLSSLEAARGYQLSGGIEQSTIKNVQPEVSNHFVSPAPARHWEPVTPRQPKEGNVTDSTFATPMEAFRDRNAGRLTITKRKLATPKSQADISLEWDDDDLKTSAVKRKMSSLDSLASIATPKQRGSLSSAEQSPFHVDTPSTPYGQVFCDNTPNSETRKKYKRYIDSFPDLYEGSPAPRERRMSTPLAVVKKQLQVKYGGVEIEGIEPGTGLLLPDGPYKQWAKNPLDDSLTGFSDKTTEPFEDVTDPLRVDAKKGGVPKTTPKVSSPLSAEEFSFTPSSGSKKPIEKNEKENEEEVVSVKRVAELLPKLTKGRKLDTSLTINNADFDADGEITPELRERVANRLKPRIVQNEDANNPLKEFVTPQKRLDELEESPVTWDLERPKHLEEMMEREMARKAEAAGENSKKVFILSNVQLGSREQYESIITNLGGELSTSNTYDPKTTHIVIEKPARSEKLLCCIASGKWVLHTSYLLQCYESRRFLPEDDYEWGNPRALTKLPPLAIGTQEMLLAKAAHRWRNRSSQVGVKALPFKEMKAVLLTQPNKTPQYSRLLEAGGATLLPVEQIYEATHCFVDEGKVKVPVDMAELVKREIHCVPPVYLADCLTKLPLPPTNEYWIESYKAAFISSGCL